MLELSLKSRCIQVDPHRYIKTAIKLSKDRDLYNEKVVGRVMAKAVENCFPADGDPKQAELSQDRE